MMSRDRLTGKPSDPAVSQFPPMTDYLNIIETEPLLGILTMNGGRCFFMNLSMAGSALTKI